MTLQYQIPQIPPAQDVASLQLSITAALNKLTNQLNQQAANSNVSGGGNRVTDVATPTSWNDAVNKRYLDNALANIPQFPPGSGFGGAAANPFEADREGYAVVTFEKLDPYSSTQVSWMVLAIDETDVNWSGSSATVTSSATSITFTQSGTSRLPQGTTFKAGDYIIWNNSSSYEINQILSIAGATMNFVVAGTTRKAFFGSTNAVQSGNNFYRCNAHSFITDLNHAPAQKHEFISANKCLVAAVSPYKNFSVSVNLNHHADSPPSPGLRTMNGTEYILGCGTATISVGQTSDIRVPVSAWHTLRNVYAYVLNSPQGTTTNGTSIQLTVLYIDPTLSTVGFIGTASIGTGSFLSWSVRPDGLNMPPQSTWPPPMLPVVTNALATTGTITSAGTNGAKTVVYQPDGFLDFIVTQVGATTAGGRLGVAVQN